MISLTEEQQSAVEVEKHLLLAACPDRVPWSGVA